MNVPYFPLYVKDHLGDEHVLLMSWEQRGMLLHFYCIAWQQAQPGTLPNDDAKLSQWVGVTRKKWNTLKPGIFQGWKRVGLLLVHEGLQAAYAKQQTFSNYQRKKAEARWVCSKKSDAGALPARKQCSSSSEEELREELISSTSSASPTSLNEPAHSFVQQEKEIGVQHEQADTSNTNGPPTSEKKQSPPSSLRSDTPRPTLPAPSSQGSVEDLFNMFWAAYPRKQLKQRAKRVFLSLGPGLNQLGRIMESLESCKRNDWQEDPQFIPLPERWLQQQPWKHDEN